MLLTPWLVLLLLISPLFLLFVCFYPLLLDYLYFMSSPPLCPPPTIHLFACHILPSALYPSVPAFVPCGQPTLTCICLAWMSPRFGLNAPIILLNYDVLLWAMLLCICSSFYESWRGTTEPFTEARLRARSQERLSQCARLWPHRNTLIDHG